MRLMLRLIYLLAVAFMLLPGCARPILNRPAPHFALPLISGGKGKVSNHGLKGKPTVINFWASWCPPCTLELPEFDDVATRYKGRVIFVAIATSDSKDAALRLVHTEHIGMPVALEKGDKIASLFGASHLPTTIILDERGYVVDRLTGAVAAGTLIDVIENTLRTAARRQAKQSKER